MVNIKKYNGKKYKTCSDYVETIQNPEKFEDEEMK